MLKSRVTGIPDVVRMASAMSTPGIDPRPWVATGYVTAFVVDPEEGPFVDVDLVLPEGIRSVTARLGSLYAGPGFGLFIPLDPDDEVIVAAPDGDPNAGLVVIGRAWSKSDPPPTAAGTEPSNLILHAKEDTKITIKATGSGSVVVESPSIILQDEGGSPKELAFKDDLDRTVGELRAHTHSGVTTGGGTSGPPATQFSGPIGTKVTKAE